MCRCISKLIKIYVIIYSKFNSDISIYKQYRHHVQFTYTYTKYTLNFIVYIHRPIASYITLPFTYTSTHALH